MAAQSSFHEAVPMLERERDRHNRLVLSCSVRSMARSPVRSVLVPFVAPRESIKKLLVSSSM